MRFWVSFKEGGNFKTEAFSASGARALGSYQAAKIEQEFFF